MNCWFIVSNLSFLAAAYCLINRMKYWCPDDKGAWFIEVYSWRPCDYQKRLFLSLSHSKRKEYKKKNIRIPIRKIRRINSNKMGNQLVNTRTDVSNDYLFQFAIPNFKIKFFFFLCLLLDTHQTGCRKRRHLTPTVLFPWTGRWLVLLKIWAILL